MKYFSILLTAVLFLSFSSCSTEEEEKEKIKFSGFVKAYGEVYSLDYAVADYAPNPDRGYDQSFVKLSNRPFFTTESESFSIPMWNHGLHLYLLSNLSSKDDLSGNYTLKGFGELEDEGELEEDSELSYLIGAVLFLNMKYEYGTWESGERLFGWTDGHVEISKTDDVYLVRFSLSNEETTYTGKYEGPLNFEEAL